MRQHVTNGSPTSAPLLRASRQEGHKPLVRPNFGLGKLASPPRSAPQREFTQTNSRVHGVPLPRGEPSEHRSVARGWLPMAVLPAETRYDESRAILSVMGHDAVTSDWRTA
jgi:hypothetical protein